MGKDKKNNRTGGRKFIENEEELEIREREITEQQKLRAARRNEDDDDESEEEGTNNQTKKDGGKSDQTVGTVFNLEKMGINDNKIILGNEHHNPNHERNINASSSDVPDGEAGLSRKEREALTAQRSKEEYFRRYAAGETEQAKKDLARLAIVRARREEAARKREAEGRKPGMSATGLPEVDEDDDDEDDDDDDDDDDNYNKQNSTSIPVKKVVNTAELSASAQLAAKKKAAAAAPADSNEPLKLSAMDIKKMSADVLKEHLKVRKLDIQGQKKDLMKRLIDYEAARS